MALHVRLQLQFPQVKVLILGICVALLGLASIVMGIVAFTKRIWGHYVATGLWGGTMVFAAGTCAIIASQLRTPCSVKSYFVCSIFGILTSFIMIVLSAGGLDYDSKFYKFAYYAHKKRHASTLLVHATTLMLSFLSFLGNIISLVVCLKYIVYDRHQTVCETKVKRSSARQLHKNAERSNSDSRVPLTGCHRSSRHHSRCKKNSTSSRESSRGERRSSDGSHRSHRHRRKHEQPGPSRDSRRRNCHALRSAIEYENITNDNILQQRQQSENSEGCTQHYQVDLLPTAFDEDELPPYEPSFENAGILPPNITPDNTLHECQVEQGDNSRRQNVKPPRTPPGLDSDVRALYLANHELADNLDSIQKRKPSTGKCSKFVRKSLEGTRSDEMRILCQSDISDSFSNSKGHPDHIAKHQNAPTTCISSSSMSHPLDIALSPPQKQFFDRTVIPENDYENIDKFARDPPASSRDNATVGKYLQDLHSPADTNRSASFDYPAFHLRLEPEGRQDVEEKDLIESHSDDNNVDFDIKLLPPQSNKIAQTMIDMFKVPEDIQFADCQTSTKCLNVSPISPVNIGSTASAFHLYNGQKSFVSPDDKHLVLSGLSDSFGGARPKCTTSTLPLKVDQISPKPTSNIHREPSWKEFLLPSSHNKNTSSSSGETPRTVKDDIVPDIGSVNSIKGQTSKLDGPLAKIITQPRPTPPVFKPPSSLKLKTTTLSSPIRPSSGLTRPITSLHPQYHQPFPSNVSLLSQPCPSVNTGVTYNTQSPLLSDEDSIPPSGNKLERVSVSQNSVQTEPNVQSQERPSLVGGDNVQMEQQRPRQQEEEQHGQIQRPQPAPQPQQPEGSRQPPLFSLLL